MTTLLIPVKLRPFRNSRPPTVVRNMIQFEWIYHEDGSLDKAKEFAVACAEHRINEGSPLTWIGEALDPVDVSEINVDPRSS